MAGNHGNSRVTVLNLDVVQADPERNLLLVQGRRARARGRARHGALRGEVAGDEGCLTWRRSTSSTRQGKKVGTRDLAADIFEAPVSVPLMHQVVVAGLAGLRAGTHSTKTRGDVSGGGKKPWRQKGTGRARQGSIRSPQWVGGGVAHGPHPRDHSMRVNKKMRRGALRSALTDALRERQARGRRRRSRSTSPRRSGPPSCCPRSSSAARCSWCCAQPTDDGAVEKSFRNLADVKVAYAGGLGTYDVLWADRVLVTTGRGARRARAGSAPEAQKGSAPEEQRAPRRGG